jgi:hypothetical protein
MFIDVRCVGVGSNGARCSGMCYSSGKGCVQLYMQQEATRINRSSCRSAAAAAAVPRTSATSGHRQHMFSCMQHVCVIITCMFVQQP